MMLTATPTTTMIAFIAALFLIRTSTSLHVAPSLEPCPHDSVLVEDICKCDPRSCSKPPCPYELSVSVNGTDTPGSCCPVYACLGCGNDTLIEGKCPCAPGAVINSGGRCQCADPHKTLVDGECVCDPDRCELPQACDRHHVSVSDKDGCCPRTKCIRCPDDSFAPTNNDDAVEEKCVCYPCTKECGPEERAVVIHHAKGFPGDCCDLYKCERGQAEAKCEAGGVVYGEGGEWETDDGQSCRCRDGIAFCSKPKEEEERSCHNEGSVYKHNESWMVDSCTNCTCVHGEIKCIAHMCEVAKGHVTKPDCHPLNCSKLCPEGYRVNKHGCKICKCNPPSKYDDLLVKYNITKNKLKDILDEYFARRTETTTTMTAMDFTTTVVPSSTEGRDYQYTTAVPRTDSRLLHVILWPLVAAVTILTIIAVVMMRKCKSHGSYDTNPAASNIYERVKLKTDTFFNNNYINKNVKGSV